MNITEKAAYIKGLTEGLELDGNKKETKIINAMLDLLTDLANDVNDLQDDVTQVYEEIDAIDEDLDDIESYLFEDEDEEDDEDENIYEITCPNCGEVVCVDEDMLDDDNLSCPNCGTKFEIDFGECECEGCDDCDCK